jgi:hypothetical protein
MVSKNNKDWAGTPHYTNSESGNNSNRNDVRFGPVSGRMLFTCLMLAGFILLFCPQGLTSTLQLAFARIFYLPLRVGRGVSLSARSKPIVDDVVSRGVYNRLENHLANVMEQLYMEHEVVEVLSGQRSRFALEGAGLVRADVITSSVSKVCSELIINRGEYDGLARGQFILSDNSVVGTISDLTKRTAQVKLFTDPESKIAVKIGQANMERLIQGNGRDSAKVLLLSRKYKIKVGDKVVARKKPGYLDAPIILGVVARCETDDENPSLWNITVKPVCDIENIKSVSVIVMNPSDT